LSDDIRLDLMRRQLAARQQAARQAAPTDPSIGQQAASMAGQFGAGSQTGIANALGFPVDAVASGLSGIGQATGMFGPIEDPVGGSASIARLLAPLNQNIPEPSTRGERIARRVGEEVGAGATMFPAAMVSQAVRAAPGTAAMVEGAATLGGGIGAGVANELSPDSPIADFIGAAAGGLGSGVLASRMAGLGGADALIRPGIEDQRQRASDIYGEVRADQRRLPQDSVDDMALGLSERMDAERINPRLQPGSSAVLDAILGDSSGPMRIEDIENLRRLTTQAMPATAAPSDRRLSQIMKDEITSYLDNLDDPVASSLGEARDAHRRASAAQTVADASTRAARRAASTGSGGNEINAMRQNLRAILDNPRRSMSFKPDELEAMRAIVEGSAGQNAMRRLSRFAPSSGGLSAMMGIGGTMASPAVALPIVAGTEIAKALGERSTQSSIANLLQSLAPNKVLSPSQPGIEGILAALLAARTASRGE
jgi:hypothetical protein